MRRNDSLWALLLLLPLLIGLSLVYYAILFSFGISFADWDIVRSPSLTGTKNYEALLSDPKLITAFKNTIVFIVFTIPLKMVFGLLFALLLNLKLRGRNFFKLSYFFPYACSIVAVALLWGHFFNPNGLINQLLAMIGGPRIYWLVGDLSIVSVGIMSIWATLGYTALLYLAGLQNIPPDYYEASRIDGANTHRQFWLITLPLLSPTTFFIFILLLITSFQVFGEVYIINSQPFDATLTIVQYIFVNAFEQFKMGYASALAYVLVVIILAITIIQLVLQKKWVHYDV